MDESTTKFILASASQDSIFLSIEKMPSLFTHFVCGLLEFVAIMVDGVVFNIFMINYPIQSDRCEMRKKVIESRLILYERNEKRRPNVLLITIL